MKFKRFIPSSFSYSFYLSFSSTESFSPRYKRLDSIRIWVRRVYLIGFLYLPLTYFSPFRILRIVFLKMLLYLFFTPFSDLCQERKEPVGHLSRNQGPFSSQFHDVFEQSFILFCLPLTIFGAGIIEPEVVHVSLSDLFAGTNFSWILLTQFLRDRLPLQVGIGLPQSLQEPLLLHPL